LKAKGYRIRHFLQPAFTIRFMLIRSDQDMLKPAYKSTCELASLGKKLTVYDISQNLGDLLILYNDQRLLVFLSLK
jgi:hypothetical protein